jgi:hypothetical protein
MKAENIDRVIEIKNTIDRITKASADVNEAIEKTIGDGDWWCTISEHSDGSGWSIDLNSLGFTKKLLSTIADMVDSKYDELMEELKEL